MSYSQDAASFRPASEVPETSGEINLVRLANILLREWKLAVGVPFAAAFLAAIISLLIPATFTATATLVPEAESRDVNLPGGLAGIVTQFGGLVPGSGNSSQFYADVLGSRRIRDQALQTRFPDPRPGAPANSASLLDILRIKRGTIGGRLEDGRDKLAKMTSTAVDRETRIISVSVESRYPELSTSVANLLVELLNRFNLETSQAGAQERRRFTQERVAEAERELRSAEDALEAFLKQNRQFEASPELSFQYERLQRQVLIKQEVFATLRRSYEEARIQEVDDTPVITVIDHAVTPMTRSRPRRRLNVILAFMLGVILATTGAFGKEYLGRVQERADQDLQEIASRWNEIKSTLRSVFRRT